MLILDTDHLSALASERALSSQLLARLANSGESVATTVVCVEEHVRGWLARIARARTSDASVAAYAKVQRAVEDLGRGVVLPFDAAAASQFEQLRSRKLGVGTADLSIAAIALSTGQRLLSRNLRDFKLVSGLRVEDWLA
jgi:tRNA(fMet)-specific endonuclease VapC